ncbi:cytochrome P450 [Phycicoccus sp. CSK15P-2]|uniref:cytochrome P450 n=1 Tax=Phycicoccus sp. CSK15P-2 TaxID=2807627 RepID=UPI0019520B0B|nr:cytochrome P450 [Phycicoccus sp. CSK15P-2]MBM6405598.1 cytochrome P450 [Phycicoccus sp. CSK15P-2]
MSRPEHPPTLSRRGAVRALAGMVSDRPTLMSRLAEQHDAVRLPFGRRHLYYFSRPEDAQHILTHNADNYEKGIGQSHARQALGDGLLTNEGAAWQRARSTMRPLFGRSQAAAQTAIVEEEALALADRLGDLPSGTEIDVRAVLTDYTIRVLGPALIGQDLTRYDRLGASFDTVQAHAIREMLTLNAVPTWAPLPSNHRFDRAMRYLEHVVDDLVDRGRDEPGDTLVTAVLREPAGEVAPRRRLRDELITMLLAGHETTASTLGWAISLVASHPDVQARIRSEAEVALGDGVSAEPERLVAGLPFTTAVIHEVLRLYPAVWLISRRAKSADLVGRYTVPAGADVLVCPYALHRDARFWTDPHTFAPDRFLDEFPASSRYAYIPFGAGPRSCIGRSLGLTESTIALTRLCREVAFDPPARAARMEPLLTLRPARGLRVAVRSRQEARSQTAA